MKESFTCEGHAFVREWALQSAVGVHFDAVKAFFNGKFREGAQKYFGIATRDASGVLWYWVFLAWAMGYWKSPTS